MVLPHVSDLTDIVKIDPAGTGGGHALLFEGKIEPPQVRIKDKTATDVPKQQRRPDASLLCGNYDPRAGINSQMVI